MPKLGVVEPRSIAIQLETIRDWKGEPNPVFCLRMVGNCIFKKVQVHITSKTTVRNEWKLNSADCIDQIENPIRLNLIEIDTKGLERISQLPC